MKKIILLSALSTLSGAVFAGESCTSIAGFFRLSLDPACNIATLYKGPTYLGTPNACFSVQVSGILQGSGYAGFTLENSFSPVTGAVAQTPAVINEFGVPATTNEFGFGETRRFVTGRSVLNLPGGRVYTSDAGVIGVGYGAEQLLIVGGEGAYAGATGVLYATNEAVGKWAPFHGRVCRPS